MVPSFSIHLLLRSSGFHRPPRYYEEIRLLHGRRPVVVASFGSTARAGPCRPPWVRTLDVPPPPSPLPPRPRLDFGHRVRRHAHPVGPACSGLHLRSVLRFASGFFPTRPHGARTGVSRRHSLRAVASGSRLLPTRPAKDFHLQSSAHARHTHVAHRRIRNIISYDSIHAGLHHICLRSDKLVSRKSGSSSKRGATLGHAGSE